MESSIDGSKIEDSAITESKISNSSITNSKIKDGEIENSKIKEDGTYVEKDVYNSSGSTNYYHGTWSYSGNKLTLIDTEEDNYTEVWTVTTMTENELVYELREKEKEDGTTYEYYEQHAFTR